tara:strand:- start:2285 stop:2884 length:600 start_codon:yes stop_codon:yes gene_type:complete
MAEVKIKLGVCFSCEDKVFTLTDQTGLYNATYNLYGWGLAGSGDNVEVDDATSSSLTVTSPSGVVYGPYSILTSIPSLDGDEIILDPTDILSQTPTVGEAFSDGVWTFDWEVAGEYESSVPFRSRCVVQRFPLCTVQCCVDKLVSNGSCNCGEGGDKKSQNAHLTLVAAKGAWNSGQKEAAKKHLGRLEDICNDKCKNC